MYSEELIPTISSEPTISQEDDGDIFSEELIPTISSDPTISQSVTAN